MNPRTTLFAALLAATLGTGCAPIWTDAPPPTPAVEAVSHRVTIPWLPPSVSRFAPLIESTSYRHGVDANLLAIVVLVESGGDPYAQSPDGAKGLMQLTPATASDIAARRGVIAHNELRLLDPSYNVDLGAWYLARQLEHFWVGNTAQSIDRAAAAYDGGPERVARGGVLPVETVTYMKWVGSMWRERHEGSSPAFDAWWRAGGERLVTRATTAPLPPLASGGPLLADDG